mgnify:CR=1 FL=1
MKVFKGFGLSSPPSRKGDFPPALLKNFLEGARLEYLFEILMENEKMAKEVCEYVSTTTENPEVGELAQWLAKREEERYNRLKRIKKLFDVKRGASNQ